jgi:two-component system, NarL family, sensor kinase
LHPPLLDETGLAYALKLYAEGLERRSGIRTSIEIDPPNFPRLKPEIETAVFRIIQECMTNVVRHSQGTQAWISLTSKDGHVVATIRDDGRGLANGAPEFQLGNIGVGVSGMRQRAKELGGEFRMQNRARAAGS